MNKYRWSNYIINLNVNNKDYMFNCKTGTLICSSTLCLEIGKLEKEKLEKLVKKKFIVKHTENELEYLEKKRKEEDKKNLDITIAVTYACNFKCSYCFVNKNNYETISKVNMDSIVMYLKSVHSNFEKLNIVWFGGEPLLALSQIEYITNEINKFIPPDRINSMIITNGYLLNNEMSERIMKLGINKLQITLDGDKESHNFYRKTSSGKDSYDIIINNIEKLIQHNNKLEVYIRINYFENKDYKINSLIEELTYKGIINNNLVKTYFAPIIDFDEKNFSQYLIANANKNAISSSVTSENIKKVILPKPKYRWCNAGAENSLVIDPMCNIYLCKSQLGNMGKIISNLKGGKIESINCLNKKDTPPVCLKCNIYPVCLGECKVFELPNKDYCTLKINSIISQIKKYIINSENFNNW